MPEPRTEFDWAIYRNATLAGLSVLIPLPIVDWIFEEFFRRRIPGAIASHRGRSLSPAVRAALLAGNRNWLTTCLTLPFKLVIGLILRLSRKLIYVLTIKEASDKVSYYWNRAFLTDYMLRSGHLDNPETALVAKQAMEQVLSSTASPLRRLAGQVTGGTRHIFRTLLRARRGGEDQLIEEKKTEMSVGWSDFEGYLTLLAARYDETYRELRGQQRLVA